MSDQPDAEQPHTFWFKCSRGHVEERAMPGDGDAPLRCWARIWCTAAPMGGAIILDECGEELRHIGPTVAEWRSTNDDLREARSAHVRERDHLQRLLAAADSALAECASQLDRSERELARTLTTAQTTRARQAEAEVERLRKLLSETPEQGYRTGYAAGYAAVRAELDQALATVKRQHEQLVALTASTEALLAERESLRESVELAKAMRDEALRDQEAMRANAAAATRERDSARGETASHHRALVWLRSAMLDEADRLDDKGRHKAANRLREHVTDSYPGGNAPGLCVPADSLIGFGLPRLEAERGSVHFSTDPYPTEPLTLDTQAARIRELEAELRTVSAELARRKHGSQGFTVIRDVNQQTQAAHDKAMAEALAARNDARAARETVCHWQAVALWAAETDGAILLPQRSSRLDRLEALTAAYDAAMEEDSR